MALDDPARSLGVQARCGTQTPPGDILWNETIATILAHRSVRAYDPRPLPPRTIETLVAATQSGASSSNLQYRSVIAVTDRAAKAELAVLAGNQRHIDEAPLLLLFTADLARTQALGTRAGVPTDGLDDLDALLVAAVDSGIAAQNATRVAESLSLGTVYIGGLRNQPLEVAEIVGLPPRTIVLFGLVVGWVSEDRRSAVTPRLPQAVILHEERYDAARGAEAIDAHDAACRAFQQTQGPVPSGWSAAALARSAGPHALNGRDSLRETCAKQGFQLR